MIPVRVLKPAFDVVNSFYDFKVIAYSDFGLLDFHGRKRNQWLQCKQVKSATTAEANPTSRLLRIARSSFPTVNSFSPKSRHSVPAKVGGYRR